MDERPASIADDLFRREAGRLVAALVRLLGPSNLALAEDVVQDALLCALEAWRAGVPRDPRAWIIQTAKNRAIDMIRKNRRQVALPLGLDSEWTLGGSVELALSDGEDAKNQLAMMLSCCAVDLADDTHVTLILRFMCGLSAREIAHAYLVEPATIERRLHRGRERLASAGELVDLRDPDEIRQRLPSVLRALYLLFNEGYHGSDPDNPLSAAMCEDALRLAELLVHSPLTAAPEVHALVALFSFNAARLATRLDDGAFVPLAQQDRRLWDRALIEHGVVHLGHSAQGSTVTRWHLEAGIACQHATAASLATTDWQAIVALYDALLVLAPSPVIAMNRALALGEAESAACGRAALEVIVDRERLAGYSFYWAALADLDRRMGNLGAARSHYGRAIELARSRAERAAYEKRVTECSTAT